MACISYEPLERMPYCLDILYGPDQQRWKSVLKSNGSDVKTIIFAGDYEKFIENGVTKELYYIGADDGLVGILVKPQVGASNMYYAHKDNLGSIVSLTDSAGMAVFKATYDAWGKQTVSLNTIGFHRGYTGHEHLPEFGLINMNGRLYDPVLGRFLSPDNYVQAADFSQSFNRYSYCVNNPLRYTDPSGEVFGIDDAIMIAMIAYSAYNGGRAVNNGVANPIKWDWSSGSTYGGVIGGGLVGWASYGVGAEIMTGQGFMANTMGLLASSHLNSTGMMIVTGGRTDYTLNFGFGSYNFTQREYDGLFDGESEWSDVLYGLGAMANLRDINNLINETKATLYTQVKNPDGSKDVISHSGIVEDATGNKLMSFGPIDEKIGGGGFKDQIAEAKPGANYKKFGLAIRKGSPDYPVPVELSKSRSVTVNKHLFSGLRGISKIIPYQGVTTNCVNMSSIGLWLNGIPNIGIHPYFLHSSMAAFNSGFNPYMFSLLSTYK